MTCTLHSAAPSCVCVCVCVCVDLVGHAATRGPLATRGQIFCLCSIAQSLKRLGADDAFLLLVGSKVVPVVRHLRGAWGFRNILKRQCPSTLVHFLYSIATEST